MVEWLKDFGMGLVWFFAAIGAWSFCVSAVLWGRGRSGNSGRASHRATNPRIDSPAEGGAVMSNAPFIYPDPSEFVDWEDACKPITVEEWAKRPPRSDWSPRPLPAEWCDRALGDGMLEHWLKVAPEADQNIEKKLREWEEGNALRGSD
jgi:hypothetical protein